MTSKRTARTRSVLLAATTARRFMQDYAIDSFHEVPERKRTADEKARPDGGGLHGDAGGLRGHLRAGVDDGVSVADGVQLRDARPGRAMTVAREGGAVLSFLVTMAKTPRMGRASIFRGKMKNGKRIQGIITKEAGADFERHRKALARLYREVYGRAPVVVSDGDAVEYLARGAEKTAAYMRALKPAAVEDGGE